MNRKYKKYINHAILLLVLVVNAEASCWSFQRSFDTPNSVNDVDFSADGSIIITAQNSLGLAAYNTANNYNLITSVKF